MDNTTKLLQFLVDVRCIKITRSHDQQKFEIHTHKKGM